MAPSVDGVIALAILGVMPLKDAAIAAFEYKCVHGHDRCDQMLPGPDCPYCEKTERRLLTKSRSTITCGCPSLPVLGELWALRTALFF